MNHIKKSRFLFWISIYSITLGLIVILGWLFDIQLFKSIVPGYVSMKLNTAIGFVLAGFLLLLFVQNKWHKISITFAFVLALLGITSLSQDIFNYNLGIDQLLITDLDAVKRGENSPGRPSPTTSLCFFLLGVVFTIIRSSNLRIKKIVQYALHIVTLTTFIAILGYLFNVPTLYKLSIFTSMAIHTSITFFVLSLGISLIHGTLGITGLFTGEKIGNFMARTLFVKMLAATLILGFLQLIFIRLKWVSIEFEITIFTTSFILVILYALSSTARLLNKIDTKRNEAEEKLISNNKNLENKVKERTAYLTKQNKQLEDFSHIVSHNLRGPTSNLKSLLMFYHEEDCENEKGILMEKFEKTVANLEGTLNELLEVISIRHESKKEKETLKFNALFNELIETYQGQIMETNAKITHDFSGASSLEYSSVYLKSIMQNLLSNALKYRSLERNPVVHFETKKHNGQTCLTVSDNGLGINMERNGKRLFGLHKTFHRHPEAKGVGLFITKAQVEAMGGQISAESEVDKGTIFKIIF